MMRTQLGPPNYEEQRRFLKELKKINNKDVRINTMGQRP